MERTIKEVTGNALDLQEYYTPSKSLDDQIWMTKLKPRPIDGWCMEFNVFCQANLPPAEAAEFYAVNYHTSSGSKKTGALLVKSMIKFWDS